MSLYIASDHAGFKLKKYLLENLANYTPVDLGAYNEESSDYPDFAKKLVDKISDGDFGILICGSGVGISIAANRDPKIRAALCYNNEIAKLSRQHNNANVICLGARFTTDQQALEMVNIFFSTEFEGGRHKQRVEKLGC